MPQAKTVVFSVDFDGCTDSQESRESLKGYIRNFIHKNPHFNNIVISISSARQSIWLDCLNSANRTEQYVSCAILGTDFVIELQEALHAYNKTVSFESILTYDVYHNLEIGTTFKTMATMDYAGYHLEYNDEVYTSQNIDGELITMFSWPEYSQAENFYSKTRSHSHTSKIDIYYMQMQHIAHNLGHITSFSFIIVDDRYDILYNAARYFAINPHTIPQSCTLQLMQHDPYYNEHYYSDRIKGTGQINKSYADDMRTISQYALQNSLHKHSYCQLYSDQLSELHNNVSKPYIKIPAQSLPRAEKHHGTNNIECVVRSSLDLNSETSKGALATITVGLCLLLYGATKLGAGLIGLGIAIPLLKNSIYAKKSLTQEPYNFADTLNETIIAHHHQ